MKTDENQPVEAFADGACKGNGKQSGGNKGGWGVLLQDGGVAREIWGSEPHTTNNRMELMAAIEALKATPGDRVLRLHVDSKYVHDGITSWIKGWKKKDWKTAAGEDVKNRDLWEMLDALASARTIEWVWVEGHAGHEGNERADELASDAAQTQTKGAR